MSDLRIGVNNFFDRGLEEITYASATQKNGLPEQSELPPAEMRSQMLNQILNLPNIESFLEESTRPDIDDRDQLMPTKFRQTLDRVLNELGQSAEAMQSGDPDGAKVLNRAVRVLREDAGLRELVQMYRSAIHQG